MRAAALLTLLLLTGGGLAGQVPASAPAMPEILQAQVDAHRLRVENAQLRHRVAQLQAALDEERLSDERAGLEQRLRDEMKPQAGHVFDWATGTFVPQKEPPR